MLIQLDSTLFRFHSIWSLVFSLHRASERVAIGHVNLLNRFFDSLAMIKQFRESSHRYQFHTVYKSIASFHIKKKFYCCLQPFLLFCLPLFLCIRYKIYNEKKINLINSVSLRCQSWAVIWLREMFFFGNIHTGPPHAEPKTYSRPVIKRLCRDARAFIVILLFALKSFALFLLFGLF